MVRIVTVLLVVCLIFMAEAARKKNCKRNRCDKTKEEYCASKKNRLYDYEKKPRGKYKCVRGCVVGQTTKNKNKYDTVMYLIPAVDEAVLSRMSRKKQQKQWVKIGCYQYLCRWNPRMQRTQLMKRVVGLCTVFTVG